MVKLFMIVASFMMMPEMDVTIYITPNLLEHLGHTCELIFEGFNDSYTG